MLRYRHVHNVYQTATLLPVTVDHFQIERNLLPGMGLSRSSRISYDNVLLFTRIIYYLHCKRKNMYI